MKVIFNADDFGLTTGVNDGIVASFKHGVVRSTTMMVGMSGEAHAVECAKENPGLKIGVHLRFTAGAPLTSHSCLKGEDGQFFAQKDFWPFRGFTPEAIYDEAVAQIEHFLSLGLPLSHLDSHHHAHTHEQLLPVIKRVAQQYNVPLRGVGIPDMIYPPHYYAFTDQFYDEQVTLSKLMNHLLELKENHQCVEVMCHPAYVDDELRAISGYCYQRETELSVLANPNLVRQLEEHAIHVTDYSELVSPKFNTCV
ncbi:chitin disaccharide deacetylase [Vibrio sonorensis]|uniref:chitin disaccharide deacetylase n=1 Tax=Vibrio sonorensis TaxID=1004316 RepID=UPI0008D9FEEA|nr:chitin disaccharide deacetylase [Vibrio sonorensis]